MHALRLRTALNATKVASNAPQVVGSSSLFTQINLHDKEAIAEKEGNPLSSAYLLSTLKSSQSTTIPGVTEVKEIKNIFGSSAFRATTKLANNQIRMYSTQPSTAVVSNKIPAHIQNALKAPTQGYMDAEDVQEVLRPETDQDPRQFTYFMLAANRFFYTAGIRLLVLRFLYALSASADVLAVAKIEVDVSAIPRGKTVTITWRGKPVFIRHRTEGEIQEAKDVPLSELKDPQRDEDRVQDENWSVLLAICTHLGCVPVTDAGSYNAFFCPCHGSHYDVSGRIRKGPAPLNLEVPKHTFTNGGSTIVLG